jgi:hypothetical protein
VSLNKRKMNTNTQPSPTWRQCDILLSRLTNQHFGDYAGGDSAKWLIIKLQHEQLLSAAPGNIRVSSSRELDITGCCQHLSHVLHSSDTAYFTDCRSKQPGHNWTPISTSNCTQIHWTHRSGRQRRNCSHAVPTFNTKCVYAWYPPTGWLCFSFRFSDSHSFHANNSLSHSSHLLSMFRCHTFIHTQRRHHAVHAQTRHTHTHTHAGMRKNLNENGNWTEMCVWSILQGPPKNVYTL